MAVPGPFDLEGEDDEMTAGQAMEQADEMRPNNEFSDSLKQNWLRQCDSRLRGSVVERSETVDFDDVGADRARSICAHSQCTYRGANCSGASSSVS